MLRLEKANVALVLGHLDQGHGSPHSGVTGVDKHHYLTHTGAEVSRQHLVKDKVLKGVVHP